MREKHGGDDDDEIALKIIGCRLCYPYNFSHIMGRDYRGADDNEDKRLDAQSCCSVLLTKWMMKTKR